VTAKFGETFPFPQELLPETVMFPETAEVLIVTVMELVLEPPVVINPVGTVQA
jgi:hypothetical protein